MFPFGCLLFIADACLSATFYARLIGVIQRAFLRSNGSQACLLSGKHNDSDYIPQEKGVNKEKKRNNLVVLHLS